MTNFIHDVFAIGLALLAGFSFIGFLCAENEAHIIISSFMLMLSSILFIALTKVNDIK
jgi:hypothetical protein